MVGSSERSHFMSIFCVIPARLNSSRFHAKLMVTIQGMTILQRTYTQAISCPEIDKVFVATDDPLIADHVKSFGGEPIFTSSTCKNGTERIGEAVFKTPELQRASLIVNLQGDHPSTSPATLSAIIQAMKEDPEAAMSTAVSPITYEEDFLSPHVVKCVFDQRGCALYFSRSPIPYGKDLGYGHIGIYCYRPSFLLELLRMPPTKLQIREDLEQLKVLENGHRIKIAVVEDTPLGIDVPQDVEKFEKYLCQLNTSS